MSKNWKESKFAQKMRRIRVNRVIYLSAIVILLTLAIVLAITAATNRARRRNADQQVINPEPGEVSVTPEPVTDPTPSKEPETKTPDKTPTKPVETVPTLSLPVEGSLLHGHSADVQVFSRTMQDYRVHLGVDFATAAAAPVLAAADGTVARIWEDPMMGWCVALQHSGNAMTVYKNLAKDLAEELAVGDKVYRGELLGYVGDTAILEIAEEPHLHLEMTVNGLQVNPLEHFSAAVLASLGDDVSFEESEAAKG